MGVTGWRCPRVAGLIVQLEPDPSSCLMLRPASRGSPPHEVCYSITAKRVPLLLLLPHLASLPPSKRIRRLCTGWPRHWS
jgi:hypothetical protein